MLTEIVVSLNLFLLVFARLGAMIFPSPVFGRKNVPMRIRAGLVLALTLLLVPVLNAGAVSALSGFDMVEGLVREILLGETDTYKAYVIRDGKKTAEITLHLGSVEPSQKDILAAGCLINYYAGSKK